MGYNDYYQTVQKVYLAYYGRTADLDGLAYWSARLDSEGGDLANIIEAFATSEEAQERYGELSNVEKISAIYQSLYDRDPDSGGLAFYLDKLEQGEMTQATIMLNVLDGSQGSDLERIDGIVESGMDSLDSAQLAAKALQYSEQLDPFTELPETLRLSDDVLYEVIPGSSGTNDFTHTSGNKIYLGLGGDDQLSIDSQATGQAVLVGGSGDDTYNVNAAGLVVINDVGGGYDTVNNYAATMNGINYTVENEMFVSQLYDSSRGYYSTILVGDITDSGDRLEAINQIGLLETSLTQTQFLDISKQLNNWIGNESAENAALTGYEQDLMSIAGLNAQHEDAL